VILLVHRDIVRAGREAEFRAAEEDAARACAEFGCPHPHLAMQSLANPDEVWWLNALESEAHRQRVADAYAANAPLTSALTDVSKRREALIADEAEFSVTYKADRSGGFEWQPAGARYVVVTSPSDDREIVGAVFEEQGGTRRYVFRPVATEREAQAAASSAGPETVIFAVRPYWGFPAAEWITADREFWERSR
jgi:hypothetical protein